MTKIPTSPERFALPTPPPFLLRDYQLTPTHMQADAVAAFLAGTVQIGRGGQAEVVRAVLTDALAAYLVDKDPAIQRLDPETTWTILAGLFRRTVLVRLSYWNRYRADSPRLAYVQAKGMVVKVLLDRDESLMSALPGRRKADRPDIHVPIDEIGGGHPGLSVPSAFDEVLEEELKELLDGAQAKLPPKQKATIEGCITADEPMTQAELGESMAATLGKPVKQSTVASWKKKAIKNLKNALNSYVNG